jgi:hypothetical protein
MRGERLEGCGTCGHEARRLCSTADGNAVGAVSVAVEHPE